MPEPTNVDGITSWGANGHHRMWATSMGHLAYYEKAGALDIGDGVIEVHHSAMNHANIAALVPEAGTYRVTKITDGWVTMERIGIVPAVICVECDLVAQARAWPVRSWNDRGAIEVSYDGSSTPPG